jgi:hypothetical protein
MAQKLYPWKLHGKPRYRQATTPRKPEFRTRRGNGRLVLDGRSARGRRLHELIAAYGIGHDLSDERATGLIKSTATLQVEIEAMEDARDRREPVDLDLFVKLINSRQRGFEQLKELKAEARAPAQSATTSTSSSLLPLQRHLHFLVWARPHKASYAKGVNDPALQAEYDRLEAEGAFQVEPE